MSKPADQLNELEAVTELKRLALEIAEHDKRYHGEDAPTISDADYDQLRQRNAEIEALWPKRVQKNSPSNKVGAKVKSGFSKVKHKVPMLSLGNAFNDEDVTDFVERIFRFLNLPEDSQVDLVAEPKIDGLSAALRYENGTYKLAATRGDGQEGEDITANIATLDDVPKQLKGDAPQLVEVRAEVDMSNPDF